MTECDHNLCDAVATVLVEYTYCRDERVYCDEHWQDIKERRYVKATERVRV